MPTTDTNAVTPKTDSPVWDFVIGSLFVMLLVSAVFSFVWGVYDTGRRRAVDAQQKAAVEAGVGRWVIDPQTGEKSFQYGR